jgi:hypothetical protein
VPLLSRKWPFLDYVVNAAPDDAGLYALWSADEMLCVNIAGQPGGIRAELQRHWRGEAGIITQKADHFSWELSREPDKRLQEVLAQFQQTYGRSPRAQN